MYAIIHKYHILMYLMSSLQVVQVLMVKKLAVTVVPEVAVEIIIQTLINDIRAVAIVIEIMIEIQHQTRQVGIIYNHEQIHQQSQSTIIFK